MDKNERERLRALCEKATPGPWEVNHHGDWPRIEHPLDVPEDCEPDWQHVSDLDDCVAADDDAEFIAAARTALPRLLDLVNSLLVAGDLVYREAMNGNSWVNFAGPHGSDLCICFDPDTAEKWGPPVRPEKHDEACTEFRTAIYTWRDTVAALKEPK